MSSLDSDSTFDQINASYYDNMSYEEDSSVSKALAFETACRGLIRLLPEKASFGGRNAGTEIEHRIALLREEIADSRAWRARQAAAVTAGGPGVIFGDFTNFRD